MEGAQTFKILAGSGQGHMLADNLRDVYPIPDLVDDVVRNQALAHSGPRCTGSVQPPSRRGRIRFEYD